MGMRQESLKRILDSTGVTARLTNEQFREIVTHLEDSIEAKIQTGVSEMQAVSLALQEMGDLGKLAKQFPSGRGIARWLSPPSVESMALLTYVTIVLFSLLQLTAVPRLRKSARALKIELPAWMDLTSSLDNLMVTFWPITLLVVVGMGIGLRWLVQRRPSLTWAMPLGIFSVTMLAWYVMGLLLPYMELQRVVR